jgi:predicted nucleotidyltransferase
LFGSLRKGDSVKDSDIDIFIESSVKKNIELKKFEKKLNHNIQLFIENKINDLPNHLFNNVVNGIKLYGSFKIK